jgi:hypothetical protein
MGVVRTGLEDTREEFEDVMKESIEVVDIGLPILSLLRIGEL